MPWGDGTGPPGGGGPGTGRGMPARPGSGRAGGGRGRAKQEASQGQDLQVLRREAVTIKEQMDALNKRIDSLLKKESPSLGAKAVIDRERCIGCGVCANVCPQGAIRIVEG